MIGLLGRKVGMTQIFATDGQSVPVSVIEVHPNRISQLKFLEKDGYNAVQLTGGLKKLNRVNKPMLGHFLKAKVEAGDMLCEFRLDIIDSFTIGQVLVVSDVFCKGDFVDVSGISKGKGFSGAIKRHNFHMQDATHGNSLSHRALGSIGQNQTPGRVFKGKKMAGQMGAKRVTTQSLELVGVDHDRNLLLVKGCIPGAPGSRVTIKPAIKRKQEVNNAAKNNR